jgi:sigma-B regulation protein RsbU (phosphoserine phosphatase)
VSESGPLESGRGFPAGGVFNAAVDAVIVMSADGVIADWNPAAERMFGYAHAFAVGRELADLIIPNALRDQHRRALDRYRETGRATILDRRLELFALCADRTMLAVELTVTRIPEADPPLFAGFIRERASRADETP